MSRNFNLLLGRLRNLVCTQFQPAFTTLLEGLSLAQTQNTSQGLGQKHFTKLDLHTTHTHTTTNTNF